MNVKEIKKEIRRLRRIVKDLKAKKLLLQSGSKERIEIHREMVTVRNQLKELKEFKNKTIEELNKSEPEKDLLIQEILKVRPKYTIDLKKFSIKELKYHLDKIKKE